jgi:hypothetical protein
MAHYRSPVLIGEGGFGRVFEVVRDDDTAPFALKTLKEELLGNPHILARFRREVRLQMGLSHPNILPIIEAQLVGERPYFVMPRAHRTLADEIEQAVPSTSRVSHLFRGIASAMAYAHRKGVIHRDLKPWNVMLTHDGVPQVSDFGLGKDLMRESSGLTQPFRPGGTVPYAAPEQHVNFRDVDHRADIYALGKILQAMVTANLFPEVDVDPRVPNLYRPIVAKCTAFDPKDRYQTVDALLADFAQLDVAPSPRPVVRRRIQTAPPQTPARSAASRPDLRLPDLYLAELLLWGLPTLGAYVLLTLMMPSRPKKLSGGNTADPSLFLGLRPAVMSLAVIMVLLAVVTRLGWKPTSQSGAYTLVAFISFLGALCCAAGAQFFFMAGALDTSDEGVALIAPIPLLGGILTLIGGILVGVFLVGRAAYFTTKAFMDY